MSGIMGLNNDSAKILTKLFNSKLNLDINSAFQQIFVYYICIVHSMHLDFYLIYRFSFHEVYSKSLHECMAWKRLFSHFLLLYKSV